MWLNLFETASDRGMLPVPRGGCKVLSLRVWHLNNLTHYRLSEGCVDRKSIAFPPTHMSLSECWDPHFKRANGFSLQVLHGEAITGTQCRLLILFT